MFRNSSMSNLYVTLATASTTCDYGFDTYLVDATSGNITLTLPSYTGDGPNIMISRIDSSTNTVTIVAADTGITVNGASSVSLNSHENVRLVMLQDHWYTVAGKWLV